MNKEIQTGSQNSKIFTRFKKIPENAFHDFYFFYQFYLPQISSLEFEEYIEIKFNYIQALFYLDKYPLFFRQADEIINELLNYTYFESRAKIIYENILYYKAEALRNENKLNAAQSLYGELMRLNPHNKIYKRKLFYLLFQNEQIRNRKNVVIVVVLILLSLLCTGATILIVNPFFANWSHIVIAFRNVFFVSGIFGYLILQGAHVRAAIRKITSITRKDIS